MVRAKLMRRQSDDPPDKAVHKELREKLPLECASSRADQKLLEKAASKTDLFICKLFERDFGKKFKNRQVVLGKPPRLEELSSVSDSESVVGIQQWANVFNQVRACPNVVRLFFANLWTYKDDFGDLVATSYVKGVGIQLDASKVNGALGLDDIGFKITNLEGWTHNRVEQLKLEAYKFLFNGGDPSVNSMSLTARAASAIIVQFLQCLFGKEMTESDYILAYKMMTREKINLGDVVMHNLDLTQRSGKRKLPYGTLLMWTFETHGVDFTGETEEHISDFFGHRNVVAINSKRKKEQGQAAGDPIPIKVQQGLETGENETEAEIGECGERTSTPLIERRLARLERKHAKLKESIAKWRVRFRHFKQTMRSWMDEILGLLKDMANQPEEQLNGGLVQADVLAAGNEKGKLCVANRVGDGATVNKNGDNKGPDLQG